MEKDKRTLTEIEEERKAELRKELSELSEKMELLKKELSNLEAGYKTYLVTVFDMVNEDNKEKMKGMLMTSSGLMKLVNFVWSNASF